MVQLCRAAPLMLPDRLGTGLGLAGKEQERLQVPGQGNTNETLIPALLCNMRKGLKGCRGPHKCLI